jgi:hypothetical protein
MVTQSELQNSVRFVMYDLWMLLEVSRMPKPSGRVLLNLWYEGLVLHSRVLRDFFYTKMNDKGATATHGRDIVAADYLPASSWPHTSATLPPYLEANKTRMDRALAHLSADRIEYEATGKDWDAQALLSEIYDRWFEFVVKLDLEGDYAAGWFRGNPRAHLVPFSPPA